MKETENWANFSLTSFSTMKAKRMVCSYLQTHSMISKNGLLSHIKINVFFIERSWKKCEILTTLFLYLANKNRIIHTDMSQNQGSLM